MVDFIGKGMWINNGRGCQRQLWQKSGEREKDHAQQLADKKIRTKEKKNRLQRRADKKGRDNSKKRERDEAIEFVGPIMPSAIPVLVSAEKQPKKVPKKSGRDKPDWHQNPAALAFVQAQLKRIHPPQAGESPAQ